MTRFDRLKNWPTMLQEMTAAELEAEYTYWRRRERELGHRTARQGAAKRAREVLAVIERRAAERRDSEGRDLV
jgi:hypothetical protein